MMWSLIVAVVTFITAIIVSLGKISTRAETITAGHREELLIRAQNKDEGDDLEKN